MTDHLSNIIIYNTADGKASVARFMPVVYKVR